MLAVATDPADARSRKKRQTAKKAVQAQTYNPRYAAIVVDVKSGATLHEANADGLRHPASLTKIMTLYLLFERLEAGRIKLDTPMDVSAEASSQSPTKLGLRPGQTLLVEEAIKGLVTKSANDAAVVVAETLAGSESEFARQMTRKARALGMNRTIYRNASGLPDNEQVTTAREQAMLGIAIQERFPQYYRYFATSSFVYRGRAMRNHNKLLGRVAGVDGIKTGYTNASGFNLVTSMHRGERHVVAVVLGGSSGGQRDARMRTLVESHIAEASTRRTVTRFAEAPTLEPPPPPPIRPPNLAALFGTPFQLKTPGVAAAAPAMAEDATAAVAAVEAPALSDEPIKPVKVKTVAVKLAAKPAPTKTAAVATASTKPQATPPAAAPVEETKTAAAKQGILGTLPAAVSAAGNAIMPKAAAAEAPAPSRHTIRGGWAIQIGAFDDETEAKQRLNAAQSKAVSVLGKADAYTERTVKGDKTLYRARFAGFDRDAAQAACKQLKRSDIACMALKN